VTVGSSGRVSGEAVIAYHERTKHHFHGFAASLGYLDWATQPNPFRRYEGAELVGLPLTARGHPLLYRQLYGPVAAEPVTRETVSLFLRYALSITAWKQAGSTRWALRANPSSGNLHPTEGYVLLPPLPGIGDAPALYHYAPRVHGLERRATLARAVWTRQAPADPSTSFLAGLTSIHWREAWKYGERAFRYCQHDAGHALAALRIAAAAVGWGLVLVDGATHAAMAHLLGLDRDTDFGTAEREEPELLALVGPGVASGDRPVLVDPVLGADDAQWHGTANVLSRHHVTDWAVIDEVAVASRATGVTPPDAAAAGLPSAQDLVVAGAGRAEVTAEQVILGRRSAVDMDGATALPAVAFFQMLARLMPTADGRAMPWDAVSWRPRLHLALFVHRVEGLTPGLYALVRDRQRLDALRTAADGEFEWHRVDGAPAGLPLFLLAAGDYRDVAARVSCGQAIAADGAFSAGMIADYLDALVTEGPEAYRRLFWEAGAIGQVLYLEAEAAGARATGIGCFFDDPVHETLGFTSREWQSLYHFTVGGPVEDTRLSTLPAYESNPDA